MTEFDRSSAVVWTISFGGLTALVAGAMLRASTPAIELRNTLAVFFVTTPILYAILKRTWAQWTQIQALVRIALYLLPMFFGVVTLDLLANWLFGGAGLLARVMELLAIAGGVAFALWASFYGGGQYVRDVAFDVFDVEW